MCVIVVPNQAKPVTTTVYRQQSNQCMRQAHISITLKSFGIFNRKLVTQHCFTHTLTETNYAGHVYSGRKAFKIICIAQLIYEMLSLPKEIFIKNTFAVSIAMQVLFPSLTTLPSEPLLTITGNQPHNRTVLYKAKTN